MRGRLPLVVMCALVVACGALAAVAPAASVEPSTRTLAANRVAARADAKLHVADTPLPAAATRVGAEPKGDHGYLKAQPLLEAEFADAVDHAWWTVPATSESAVIAYVKANRPAGTSIYGTGGGGNVNTGTTSVSVILEWPAVSGRLGDRLLEVTATALPGGLTGVLAESQTNWVVPRPTSERIPTGVTELVITHRSTTVTVTSASKIQRVIALANALPITQPGVTSCFAIIDPTQEVFTFRSASGSVVAVLTATVFDHTTQSGVCNPLTLTIGGRRQHELLGGSFVAQAGHVIGHSLA